MARTPTSLLSPARLLTRKYCTQQTQRLAVPSILAKDNPCPFGLLLDIDGVLCRGRVVLPGVLDAFHRITDAADSFLVPTVFVTNAGNTLRKNKAESLTKLLNKPIHPEQVVLSHSPLRMFTQFHDKHILAVGQGPLMDIARNCGFTQVTTLDHLRSSLPHLDCADFRRRTKAPYAGVSTMPKIDAVVLFGEPLAWESALQFIIDVLITDGQPEVVDERGYIPPQHMPVLACNTDMLWMSETTKLPRLGHGTFLLCLETLYRKLTSNRLHYTALMGKPAEVTYHHAAYSLRKIAQKMNIPPPTKIYAIGDNPESDILGANMFDRELQSTLASRQAYKMGQAKRRHSDSDIITSSGNPQTAQFMEGRDSPYVDGGIYGVQRCYSMLVETGVYSANCKMNGTVCGIQEQTNLTRFADLRQPDFHEADLSSAITTACEKENWSTN